MSLATETRAAYRSILREIARSSIHPRHERNKTITWSVRVLFEDASKAASAPDTQSTAAKEATDKLLRDVRNAVTFLRAQRMHKELLDRYNPLRDITQEERVKATARRVGLDVPIEGKEEQ